MWTLEIKKDIEMKSITSNQIQRTRYKMNVCKPVPKPTEERIPSPHQYRHQAKRL